MTIATIVDSIMGRLDAIEVPASILPAPLLKSVAAGRPGLSAYKIAANIIENNKVLGIPTTPNPDGSENMINQYTYNVVKCIVDALKNDAVIQVAIPCESLLVNAKGANAGGPVECIGTNMKDSISTGIIQ